MSSFDAKAKAWDQEPRRLKLAQEVAQAIRESLQPDIDGRFASRWRAMDLGCGTGLVTLELAPLFGSVRAVDSSDGMLEMLSEKLKDKEFFHVTPQKADLSGALPWDWLENSSLDVVFSSMTLHHIAEVAPLFRRLYAVLKPGGRVCLADLDLDQGEFHDDNTGVAHFGFDRTQLQALLESEGFREVRFQTAAKMRKKDREFSVFLVTAQKTLE